MFIARVMCGLTHVTVAALFCSSSLLRISNSDSATENEAGHSVNGNEEPRWRDLSPIQFSCNCNYSLITHNKTPVHSTWGLLRVCAACPTLRLNLSSEIRPSGNNIQDTFPHRVHAGYNNPEDKKKSDSIKNFVLVTLDLGTAVAQWLGCCVTNRKVAGSIPAGVIGIFHWQSPFVRTQPLTEMSTIRISWG